MKLQHITFTGIDGRTDLDELCEIQQAYPIVEWGVLVAKNWKDNGNRFFNPSYLDALEGRRLNLSAHLCGSIARAAVRGNISPFYEWSRGNYHLFNRCQLNIATSQNNPSSFDYSGEISSYFDEVILQQKSTHEVPLFLNCKVSRHITCLLDASGGQGIDTPIEVLNLPHKIGYAGGINADNVADKLSFLMSHVTQGTFWIDMESGVRTDDWFDLGKVRQVLEICQPIIREYKKHD